MRVVLVGMSPLAVMAARELLGKGHEVVLIEKDPEKLESLGEELDCGIVRGDGSRPDTLEKVGPGQTDFLFCLSNSDEANILAALVGRALGFERVVAKIEDPTLQPICTQLELHETIVPDREVAQGLCDMVAGAERADLSAAIREGLRFFSFALGEDAAKRVGDIELPKGARVIARSRGDLSILADADTALRSGDELVLLLEEALLPELQKRFEGSSQREAEGR